jgi:hypothetical protein
MKEHFEITDSKIRLMQDNGQQDTFLRKIYI